MGAIVNIRVPQGEDITAVKDILKSRIEQATGETVTINAFSTGTANVPSTVQTGQYLPNSQKGSFLQNTNQ